MLASDLQQIFGVIYIYFLESDRLEFFNLSSFNAISRLVFQELL